MVPLLIGIGEIFPLKIISAWHDLGPCFLDTLQVYQYTHNVYTPVYIRRYIPVYTDIHGYTPVLEINKILKI